MAATELNQPIIGLNKVVIFGVGLIGGSFALALKQHAAVKQIVGVGRSQLSLERALALGIVDSICISHSHESCDSSDALGDSASLAAALDGADLVLIAAPVAQTESILARIYPHLQTSTIVTDAGSTKSDVVASARRALHDKIAQFVPAHPIAGREENGPEAALAGLYQGKKLVIAAMPENTPAALELVAAAWRCCGAVPYYLSAAEHDNVFAAVSHLPHLLAYALVDQIAHQPTADIRFQFAASGFRDFTRIAGSSPEMWRDISLANRTALLDELALYQQQLQRLQHDLQEENGEALLAMFSSAQQARQRWTASIEVAEKPGVDGGD